ncbi:hypothetical protein ACWEQL_30120 [Kitasatospora sp. NPDC004240]
MSALPPIGAEFPCSLLAGNCTVEYQDRTLNVDFRGGLRQRVEVDPDDPLDSVRLRIAGFRMAAESERGTITLEQNDAVDVDADSLLKLTRRLPPTYEHRQVMPAFITVIGEEVPVVLFATTPLVLVADLGHFPPRGDTYRLENPVNFVEIGRPLSVLARFTAFPARQTAL